MAEIHLDIAMLILSDPLNLIYGSLGWGNGKFSKENGTGKGKGGRRSSALFLKS